MRATMSGRLSEGEKLTLEAYEAMHSAGYPDTFLVLMMQLAEETQLLYGSGTAPQLQGFLTKTGLQDELDKLSLDILQLLTG